MDNKDQFDERTRSLAWVSEAGESARLLVFWEGGFAAREIRPGKSLVVGRALECDVHVVHPSVSRRHVAVHAGPPLQVEDLGSANGTLLNGTSLHAHQATLLEPGKVVEAGAAVLVVHAPGQSSASDALAAAAIANDRASSKEPMARVRRLVELVAVSGLSVILLGETGVGKDVTAEMIHKQSPRARGPFVRLNCAAVPEALLESELFGHERGAFTGAVSHKPGLLETANGGTFLLDEVAEMPLSTQAKLLRVLENREVRRVGGLDPRPIDVRFIAATNRNLAERVTSDQFRRDLYYRLNGISIRIPPLRERLTEIAPLARAFVEEACARAGRSAFPIDSGVLQLLQVQPWPGNIRELRNVIERAIVLCEGEALRAEHIVLDESGASPAAGSSLADLRDDVAGYERARILDALERAGGSQTRAAALLGITRRALVGRIAAHGLPRPRKDRKKGP
jgi:two-component system, NtrC family, response regulator AtoC